MISVQLYGSTCVAWTPAKVNLLFEVLAKRPDGFHEVETLMVPVALYDTLLLDEAPRGEVTLRAAWAGGLAPQSGALGDLPQNEENLAHRAVQLLRDRANIDRGVRVQLIKRIPSAAGLGGASSDAAAALLAVNRLWRLDWTNSQLAELAAELGSDVPFFLGRGAAVCTGRGERIEPVDGLPRMDLVIARPAVGLSTAEVYRHCKPAVEPRRAAPLIDALRRGDWSAAGGRMANRLQQPAESLCDQVRRLEEQLERLDLPGHQMSGSGSSCFALCRNARQARRTARLLAARGYEQAWATFSIST